mmetsp:Transcript_25470/g.41323  ORF Transcript_25470/g.41323 Transcript_25470/m.41323 type:complete len:132 (+) Transcript_25470:69-464(+)
MRSPALCVSMPLMVAWLVVLFVASLRIRVVAVSLDEVAGESTVIVDAIGELLTDALQLSDEDLVAASKVHRDRPPKQRHGRNAHRAVSGSIPRKQSHEDQQKVAELLELDEKIEADVSRTKMMRSEPQKRR